MKKAIFTLTIFFSFYTLTSASGSCDISSGPSPRLSEYIQDIDIVLTEIGTKAKSTCKNNEQYSKSLGRSSSKLSNDYNKILDVGSFTSSFKSIMMVTDGDLVDPVYRDYNLIKYQHEKINKYSDSVTKKCALDIEISDSNVINNFLIKYDWGNKNTYTIEDTISKLREINGDIFSFYVNAIIGEKYKTSDADSAGKLNLKNDFLSYYTGDKLVGCKQEYGSGIIDKLEGLFATGAKVNGGFDVWKNSWNLLIGNDAGKDKYSEVEKKLLSKELGKQGISPNGADQMMKNLESINKCSDPACIAEETGRRITGTLSYFGDFFTELKNDLTDTKQDKNFSMIVNGKKVKYNPNPAKTTDEYIARLKKIETTSAIFNDIQTSYNTVKSEIDIQNTTLDSNIGNLVNLYYNLVDTNLQIKKNINVAEELCNCQASGIGNCHF
ncbi:hypothetical protein M0P65_02145 [Candidatus Gracilibacteria bacterium]|nr:hypothetical protein [Candidatus Gracilibacteria bacterium]